MSDLVAFIEARLEEDEELARQAARRGDGGAWVYLGWMDGISGPDATLVVNDRHIGVGLFEDDPLRPAEAEHIARHDPARVLRDVAATRWILQKHTHYRFAELAEGCNKADIAECPQAFPGTEKPYVGCRVCDWNADYEEINPHTWCSYVRQMGAAWSDHPDYPSGHRKMSHPDPRLSCLTA